MKIRTIRRNPRSIGSLLRDPLHRVADHVAVGALGTHFHDAVPFVRKVEYAQRHKRREVALFFAFVDGLRDDYTRVSLFKPKSSRKESRELYIIAQKRRIVG